MKYIIDRFLSFIPVFQIGWIISVLLGLTMLLTAFINGRKENAGKAPWILGSIGTVMTVTSGIQLLFSLFV